MAMRTNSVGCVRFTTGTDAMKDFSNASFPPETISINGRGGRDAARPGKCGPRKFDSRNYPPHCQGRRKRPSNFATYGAIGASNYAAQLNGGQVKNGCYWGGKPAGHLFRFQGVRTLAVNAPCCRS